MSRLENAVRTAVADLAAEAPYVTDLATAARRRGHRIQRRRRMVLGVAVAALAGTMLIPYTVLGGNAGPTPVPAASALASSAPTASKLPPAPVIRKDWWESPVGLPGGFVVTGLSPQRDPGSDPQCPEGTTVRDAGVVLDRSTGRYRISRDKSCALLAAPVGKYAALFDADSRIGIMDATTGHVRRYDYGTRSGGNGFASDAQWSPDGTKLLLTRPTGIRILHAGTGDHQDWDIPELVNLRSFTWLPGGTEIAVAAPDTTGTLKISVYSFSTRELLRTLAVQGAPVSQNAWSPDGRYVLLLPEDRAKRLVQVAEVATGRTVATLPSAGSAYFVSTHQILVIYNGIASLYDLTGKLLQKTTLPSDYARRQISVGRP